ncbi:MAG: hypothetical protein M1438_09275 [Deltaproteobacteria bacterium]|nr:hypothetical protein [Deltaproteobacteria bacterium]
MPTLRSTPESDCLVQVFRPLSTNANLCARYFTPVKGAPFCGWTGEDCPNQGLRLAPRADQEEDSFE